MKKILVLVVALLAGNLAHAEDTPKLLANLGGFNVYIPLTQIDVVYQYDMVGKRSLIGGETPIFAYKSVQFTGGAVTSIDGAGSPFVGVHVALENPVPSFLSSGLSSLKPGLFGGRDFKENAWLFGFKLSKNIF